MCAPHTPTYHARKRSNDESVGPCRLPPGLPNGIGPPLPSRTLATRQPLGLPQRVIPRRHSAVESEEEEEVVVVVVMMVVVEEPRQMALVEENAGGKARQKISRTRSFKLPFVAGNARSPSPAQQCPSQPALPPPPPLHTPPPRAFGPHHHKCRHSAGPSMLLHRRVRRR